MTVTFPCGCTWPRHPQTGHPVIDVWDPPDCPAVWAMLGKGLTKGVFQLESYLGRKWAARMKPGSIDDLAALVSILRPGALNAKDERGISMTENYCRRRLGEEPVPSVHPVVDSLLAKTYGAIIFQETIMECGSRLAGFDLGTVDELRKCVTGDTMFVSRTRGWVTIDRLLAEGYADDEFYLVDEFGKFGWRSIEKIWPTGKRAVSRVLGQGGLYVHATKNHQFLTADGWKARQRLSEEDWLVGVRQVDYDGHDHIDPSMAFVIAGLLTEGYFVDYANAHFTAFDAEMMGWFVQAFEEALGEPPVRFDNDGKVAFLSANQKKRVSKFMRYGKSAAKRLPDQLMGATKETTRQFLSFMLAAEGGITEDTGHFEWSSKSFQMMRQVQLLLLRFGVRSYWLTKDIEKYGRFYRLYVNDRVDQMKMFRELTGKWPASKREMLLHHIFRKGATGYTTDVMPQSVVKCMLNQYPSVGSYESVTVYNSPVSRTKFARLAHRTGDPVWASVAMGRHAYQQVKAVDDHKRSVHTYDFTVEGGDAPFIVANGLVIHNSVGKKDVQKLAEVGRKFIAGCETAGVVDSATAQRLWDNIKESGRYCFNASHAYGYARTSYKCAYSKAHLAPVFFTSWLDLSHTDETPELVREAKAMGVPVEGPDARRPTARCVTDGTLTRFSTAALKHVGLKDVELLVEAVGSRQYEPSDWLLYLTGPLQVVSSTTAAALVEGGCCDWSGLTRSRMLNEYRAAAAMTERERLLFSQLYRDEPPCHPPDEFAFDEAEVAHLTPRQQAARRRKAERAHEEHRDRWSAWKMVCGPCTLSEGLRRLCEVPKGGPSKERATRLTSLADLLDHPPTSEADDPHWAVGRERYYLGVALRSSQVAGHDDLATHTCRDVLRGFRLKFGERARLAVEVLGVTRKVAKTGKNVGASWATLVVEDETGALSEVKVFAEAWGRLEPVIAEGNACLLTGWPDAKEAGVFVVDDARPL